MSVKIIECPRDAMQGITHFIPTATKIAYIKTLMQVGFDTLDMGSFVSEKAVPQLRDTHDVFKALDEIESLSKWLAIVANERGAKEALGYQKVHYLGFPFSVSEVFQKRNTQATLNVGFERLSRIHQLCEERGKVLVVYLSMAFGNPYGEPYHPDMVLEWTQKLHSLGIRIVSVSDTVGAADLMDISYIFGHLLDAFPTIEFGAHFHALPGEWKYKIDVAYRNGCRRFDGALKGFGGCPMAKDELTGNVPTEEMCAWFEKQNITTGFSAEKLKDALLMAPTVFG